MQATLDAVALKSFARALTCLSRYGDDLRLRASPNSLTLSTTNSSMTAYCSFKLDPGFFLRYRVGDKKRGNTVAVDEVVEVECVTGQILTKSLLSVLKHRAVEKTVDKCELSIVDAVAGTLKGTGSDEDEDSLESRLVVRLHCKHGVVKTHRLLLQTQTFSLAPQFPVSPPGQSRLIVGSRAIKDMIEHFPYIRGSGGKNSGDSQLVWTFDDANVSIKTIASGVDAKGKSQLATEIKLGADEFDQYDIYDPPITITFHLREFNATVAFAESASVPLDIYFTDPLAPLFIEAEADHCYCISVIATSQVGMPSPAKGSGNAPQSGSKKRERESADTVTDALKSGSKKTKSMKVVQKVDPSSAAVAAEQRRRSESFSMPPPSGPLRSSQHQPLFLPSSQLSLAGADEQAIRASGLGIENMNEDEFLEMLEGEGEEVDFGAGDVDIGNPMNIDGDGDAMGDGEGARQDSFDLYEDSEIGMAPTQTGDKSNEKTFRPLFED